jgi:hypothetical protein
VYEGGKYKKRYCFFALSITALVRVDRALSNISKLGIWKEYTNTILSLAGCPVQC